MRSRARSARNRDQYNTLAASARSPYRQAAPERRPRFDPCVPVLTSGALSQLMSPKKSTPTAMQRHAGRQRDIFEPASHLRRSTGNRDIQDAPRDWHAVRMTVLEGTRHRSGDGAVFPAGSDPPLHVRTCPETSQQDGVPRLAAGVPGSSDVSGMASSKYSAIGQTPQRQCRHLRQRTGTVGGLIARKPSAAPTRVQVFAGQRFPPARRQKRDG